MSEVRNHKSGARGRKERMSGRVGEEWSTGDGVMVYPITLSLIHSSTHPPLISLQQLTTSGVSPLFPFALFRNWYRGAFFS
ncbi:hypothetical protein [Leptothermofonsia sp. ETS-13]|uniref:hypothetical protein n=1 Tax=Leptothermofonsia sp. ETS-13 TaxID=3035696 RepID=UPI003BA3CAF4